jgi:hypothetical protein
MGFFTMSAEKLDKALGESFEAIEFCIPKGLTQPALQLIFTTIDILGWLDRPKNPKSNQRGVKYGFMKWVKNYALRGADYRAIDLYAGRCGLLHEGTPNSDLSRSGKAKRIVYCWGTAKPELIETVVRKHRERTKVVIIDIDYLYKSLRDGYDQFKIDLGKNGKRRTLVYSRVAEMYGQVVINKEGAPRISR